MQVRERLHQLIDELPEDELLAVERFVADRRAIDSRLRPAWMDAPEDDEPLTPEDIAGLEEAYADLAAGRIVSDDELWRRLGHAPRR